MRSSGYCSGLRQGGSSSCKEVSMSNIGLADAVGFLSAPAYAASFKMMLKFGLARR
jgi:hypothetical protein